MCLGSNKGTGRQYLDIIHFALAGLTPDFEVNIKENVCDQFGKFAKAEGRHKKAISIGGWAESTEPGTFQRCRGAVKPASRDRFVSNVPKFRDKCDLDGFDFDWEYDVFTLM
ncbi:hypothetical protein ACJZ2D_004765 [Fusarium nematophilum]